MPQIPSSSPGPYPATTTPADPYNKGLLSGAPNFTTEPPEIPLPTSLAPPLPLGIIPSDHQQPQPPAVRSQYGYSQSAATPRQVPSHGHTVSSGDPSLSMPRYADASRPIKSPRTAGHQSIHGASAAATHEAQPDYRYSSYASITGPGDVPQQSYGSEPSSATSTVPPRDYYPPSNTWTTTAGEATAGVAYASGDGRPYTFPQEPFKAGQVTSLPIKPEAGQAVQASPYAGSTRAPFVDHLSNYSWGSN